MTNKNEQRKVPELRFPEFSGEWEEKELSSIIDVKSGKDYKHLIRGNVPVYGTGGLMLYVDGKLSDRDGVGIGRKGSINKPQLLKAPFWTVDTLFYCIPKVNNDLYYIYTLYQKINWLKYDESTGVPSLSKATINKIKQYFPEFKEQQKIGDFFSKLDRQIELEEKKLALLEEQKKGYMQKIFSQELRFKDENGEEYPEWERVKLVDICNFRRGSFPQPYGERRWYDSENGKPFVQVFDVDTNMKIKKMTKNKISKIAEAKSVLAKPGNILVTLQGSIGRVAVLEYEAFVDRTLLIINDFLVDIDPDFFKYLLLLKFDEEKRKAPGGTIKTITKEVLSEFKVKLPVFEYQQKVAMMFKDIDESLIRQNKKISLLNERKNNLLNKIFI